MKMICVYCGSSGQIGQKYLDAAYKMGAVIAMRGMGLVYGAGSTGLMGAVANGALENSGEVIGITPEIFNIPQLAHDHLTRFEVVADIHACKARMAELADGFVALPGGFGTLEEFFEILAWAQIGLHEKPIGILNVDGYYDGLLDFMKVMERQGFIYKEHNQLFQQSADPDGLLDKMNEYRPPKELNRWVDR